MHMPRLFRFVMPAALACAAVCSSQSSATATAAGGYAQARTTLTAAADELRSHFADVQRRNGAAPDLQGRIDSDLAVVTSPTTPPGWTAGEYADAYSRIAALDASLVDQLSTGVYHDVGAVRGLDDVLIESPADRTMQPVALYVP